MGTVFQENIRKLFFYLLIITLFFASGVSAETLVKTFNFSDDQLTFRQVGAFEQIFLSDGDLPEDTPGVPWLPVRYISIALPEGAVVESVLSEGTETLIRDNITVIPVQEPSPLSAARAPFTDPVAASYTIAEITPVEHGLLTGSHNMRGYRFITVRLNPLRYLPKHKKLYFSSAITLKVNYSRPLALTKSSRLTSSLFENIVKNHVVNPEMITGRSIPLSESKTEDIQYLIITDNALKSAFQTLATHRENRYTTAVLTKETIDTEYSGNDIQEKIRNAIKDYVDNHNTEYIAIGGDDTIIPDRDTSVSCGSYSETGMPTDLYYSGLDGDWDGNGNNVYGETDDAPDMAFDVIVGRIPVQTTSHANAYINKLIDYENNHPDNFDGKLLIGGDLLWNSYSGDDRPSDEMTDGHIAFKDANHGDVSDAEMWMRRMYKNGIQADWTVDQISYMFDTMTSWDESGSSGNYSQNATNMMTRLNEGWYLMNFFTHGNKSIWGLESGSFSSSNAAALTGLVAILYTEACLTGHFDNKETALSEAFIRNGNGGAINYIGCSRYGWGSPDSPPASSSSSGGPSASYAYQFNNIMFASPYGTTIGSIFAQHKAAKISSSSSNGSYRWIQFGLNLQGDPAVPYYKSDGDDGTDTDSDGLTDWTEDRYCTDKNSADSDSDGIDDGIEDANHNGVVDSGETNPCKADSDDDGLDDLLEISACTSPVKADTDDDGLNDSVEDANKNGIVDNNETNPCNADSDGDGLDDLLESSGCTSPLESDTDSDGLSDSSEDANQNGIVESWETDPCKTDTDDDGLPDNIEIEGCTNALIVDSDNDGITDGIEDTDHDGVVDAGESNPCEEDTDNDGIPDGEEDMDRDGIVDSDETDPNNPDTDSDGIGDNADLFPTDPNESSDNDNDGNGDNGDTDDDNDGMPDSWELKYGLNPFINDADLDKDEDDFTNLAEYTDGTRPDNKCPDIPMNESPTDSDEDMVLTPELTTGSYEDPENDLHKQTLWEVSTDNSFEENKLVFRLKSSEALSVMSIPELILQSETVYFWRVRYFDTLNGGSKWSDTTSFTTADNAGDGADVSGADGLPDGIPDQDAIQGFTDINQDDISDNEQSDMLKCMNTNDDLSQICIKAHDDDLTIEKIDYIEPVTPPETESESPDNDQIKGMFGLRLKVLNSGSTAKIIAYFSKPVENAATCYKYNAIDGWQDYSDHVLFSGDMMSATISIKDGGFGDIDGVENGTIIARKGIIIPKIEDTIAQPSTPIYTSDAVTEEAGSGCFIITSVK